MGGFASPDAFLEKMIREQEPGDDIFNTKVVENIESSRPRLKDFTRIYGPEIVAQDTEALRERQRDWGAKPAGSQRLEYMVMDGIGRRDWLGGTTDVTPANEFDDVFNGIDIVVRFDRDDKKPLYLGIDVTGASRQEVLAQKLRRSLDRIQSGGSERVKYYPTPSSKELPLKLPRVVLGTDGVTAEKLYQDYLSGFHNFGTMTRVNEHPMQMELLRQIKRQLMLGTEAAARAFARAQAKERSMDRGDLALLNQEIAVIRPLELDELEEKGEWNNFVALLTEEREAMTTAQPELARHVFQHTDMAEEIDAIAQEKSSQGIESERAHKGTEEVLEVPQKVAVMGYQ